MLVRKIVTGLTAAALVAAPTMAVAQSAAPEIAPAGESVEGSELRGGGGIGQVFPLFLIAAIVFAIRELVKSEDPGDDAISP
jgi:hypothetical protein